jgi:hypothetical protein
MPPFPVGSSGRKLAKTTLALRAVPTILNKLSDDSETLHFDLILLALVGKLAE